MVVTGSFPFRTWITRTWPHTFISSLAYDLITSLSSTKLELHAVIILKRLAYAFSKKWQEWQYRKLLCASVPQCIMASTYALLVSQALQGVKNTFLR